MFSSDFLEGEGGGGVAIPVHTCMDLASLDASSVSKVATVCTAARWTHVDSSDLIWIDLWVNFNFSGSDSSRHGEANVLVTRPSPSSGPCTDHGCGPFNGVSSDPDPGFDPLLIVLVLLVASVLELFP